MSGALVWTERWYFEGESLCGTGFSIAQEGSTLSVNWDEAVDFAVSEISFTAPELKAVHDAELHFSGMFTISDHPKYPLY
jgi:hypothetical protein